MAETNPHFIYHVKYLLIIAKLPKNSNGKKKWNTYHWGPTTTIITTKYEKSSLRKLIKIVCANPWKRMLSGKRADM